MSCFFNIIPLATLVLEMKLQFPRLLAVAFMPLQYLQSPDYNAPSI